MRSQQSSKTKTIEPRTITTPHFACYLIVAFLQCTHSTSLLHLEYLPYEGASRSYTEQPRQLSISCVSLRCVNRESMLKLTFGSMNNGTPKSTAFLLMT